MNVRAQSGYTDMQFMPMMIGVVLLYVIMGQLDSAGFDFDQDELKLAVFLLLATAALLYGFGMHLYALGYPESPFNKHSSPVFMTLLCAGPLAYVAYRFYVFHMLSGFWVYAALALVVIGISIGFGVYRKNPTE